MPVSPNGEKKRNDRATMRAITTTWLIVLSFRTGARSHDLIPDEHERNVMRQRNVSVPIIIDRNYALNIPISALSH